MVVTRFVIYEIFTSEIISTVEEKLFSLDSIAYQQILKHLVG